MRILVATDLWFPDFRGGAARVARETARGLAARGHEVTVLAPAKQGSPEHELCDGFTLARGLWRGPAPQSVTDIISSRRFARRMGKHYDILLAHQVTTACGFTAARTALPLVLVCHGSPVREARLAAGGLTLGRHASVLAISRLLRTLERIAVRHADRVVVLSDYMAELLAGDFPKAAERIRVVQGGIDSTWFSEDPTREEARNALDIRPDQTLVLAVRKLERGLGLEALLRAFRLVLDTREVTFVLLGDGSLRRRLETLGNELGLGAQLQLVGTKDGAELRRWYRAADAFVLPPAPHEGFGLATVEALASGVPAVAAPTGASPGILTPLEPRLVAQSAEPGDLADAIGGALNMTNPDFRRRCREYAASRFRWDSAILDWERILVDVRTRA